MSIVVLLSTGDLCAQDGWPVIDIADAPVKTLLGQDFRQKRDLPAETPFDAVAEPLTTSGDMGPRSDVLSVGLSWSKFWAIANLENTSRAPVSRQIRTPLTAAGELEILLLREGQPPQVLLNTTYRHPFDARPVNSRKLISAPLTLAPGEHAQLAVGYRPLGFSRLPLWLSSLPETQTWTADLARTDAAFYTGVAVLIACFLGFCLVIRNRTGVMFAGLLGLNLGIVAQLEGHLFRFIWPEAPLFNLNATLPMMLVAAGFGYVCTLQAAGPALTPQARRVIYGALGLSMLHLAATPFAHPTLVTPGSLILWIGAFVAIAASLPGWAQFSNWQRRVGQAVSGAMVLASLGMVLAALSGGAPVWSTSDTVLRSSYLLASGGLMVLLLMQVASLYRAHQNALAAQVEAAQTEAELNAALLDSERDYTEAVRRAAQAQQRLAAASHDIQQPVTALRLLLQRDQGDRPEAAIADALAYLENMAGAYTRAPKEEHGEPTETYDLGLVVRAAADMFRDEAESHNMTLDVAGTQVTTNVPTVAMMRIVSNLTVNAIRHSGGQTVRLSVTADDATATVSVTNDGAHLSPDDFARFQAEGEKGPESQGDGLGLAIISELCRSHGLTLALDEAFVAGTRLTVTLPRAR